MKKNILITGSLCVMGLVGCQRNDLVAHYAQGDRMEVEVTGSNYTRADEPASSDGELLCTRQFITEEGDTLYISAYLSDLNDFFPQYESVETKGAPIDNDNLGSLYGTINTTVYDANGIYESIDKDGTGTNMENVPVLYGSAKWSFNQEYYWPKTGGDLYFCSMAPVELLPGGGTPLVSGISWDKSGKLLTFDYTMPAPGTDNNDAVNQKDLLAGVDKNNKENGSAAGIGLYHALTGVRFVMGETNSTSIKLKSVSLNNFYSKGTATFNRNPSGTDPKITWSALKDKKDYTQSYSDTEIENWVKDTPFDKTTNEEKTFMVIPQKLDEAAELSIYLANALHPETLTFKVVTEAEPGLADWSKYAGKMITFRISSYIGLVSVDINDECSTTAEGYGVKSKIQITNTGNANIYVRAELVGNWVNADGQILASWKEDNSFGEFESAGGAKNSDLSAVLDANWQKAPDGFYYYKYYVKPGDTLKHNMFKSFTIKGKPADSSGDWAGDVNMQISALELNVLVQAVRAETGKASASAAWGSANIGFLTENADN